MTEAARLFHGCKPIRDVFDWSQECKKRLAADTARAATSDEIKGD